MTKPGTRNKGKVTISDVSRLAGCSKGVVSAVVNNARGNISVSDQMRKRVLDAAAELGYRPNYASQCLARNATKTLGIYVAPAEGASVGYPYEGRILRGIEMACRAHDYDLLILNIGGSVSPEQCLQRFAEGRVDGVIIVHASPEANWISSLSAFNQNVVAVNHYGPHQLLTNVVFDDHQAGVIAAKELARLGHTRIGYLGGVAADHGPGGERRLSGYHKGMAEAGLPIHDAWIYDVRGPHFADVSVGTGWSWEDGPNGADYFLSLVENRPTALVVYGDTLGLKAMHHFQNAGLNIPRDISLITIGGSETCHTANPMLSSAHMPLEEMSEYAALVLIDKTHRDSDDPFERKLWAPSLVPRDSTAPPA